MNKMGRAAQLRWAVLYAQAFSSNQAEGWAMQTPGCFGQALLSGTQSYSLQYVEPQTQFPVKQGDKSGSKTGSACQLDPQVRQKFALIILVRQAISSALLAGLATQLPL